MNLRRFLVTALLVVAGICQLRADDFTASFDQANKLYEEGKFRDAAVAYEKIAVTGARSPALLFNLGNAYFKAGQMGEAIAAYRAAEMLAPRDPDLRANLQFARARVSGATLKPSWLHRAADALTLNEWTLLGLLPAWAWFALLIARQLKPALKLKLRGITLAAGFVTVLGITTLGLIASQHWNEHTAIVTARNTVVRYGPLIESSEAFTANDGAELRVLDAKNEWLQVTDDAKFTGWLRTNSVRVLN
ncbi:MAG: hypothetical protein RLY20_2200 [Verrucomicrobiota bacterium]|jgi:tetratricopeptide (TPR) repeat protein